MTTIEIKITSNGLGLNQANLLVNFLTSLQTGKQVEEIETISETVISEPVEEKKTRKRVKKEEPQAEEPQAEEPQAEEPQAEEPQAEEAPKSKITLLQIRAVVAEKKDDHRDKLKAKLDSLGNFTVSTLPEQHYEEFYNYAKSL